MNLELAQEILGVPEGATAAEIDSAFRRLASVVHPDRGGDDDQMAQLSAARETLLAVAKPAISMALTRVDEFRAIAIAINEASAQRTALDAEVVEIRRKLAAKSVNRLKDYRLGAAIAAAALAACTFLAKEAPKSILPYQDQIRQINLQIKKIKDDGAQYESAVTEDRKQSQNNASTIKSEYEATLIALGKQSSKRAAQEESKYRADLRDEAKRLSDEIKIADQNYRLAITSDIPSRTEVTYSDHASEPWKSKTYNFGDGKWSPDYIIHEKSPAATTADLVRIASDRANELLEAQAYRVSFYQNILFFLTISFGLASGVYSIKIKRAELAIDELNEQLNSKTLAFRMMRSAFGEHGVPQQFGLIDLTDAVEKWGKSRECEYSYIIHTLGALSFAQYLIARARQIELLESNEEIADGQFLELFKIKTLSPGQGSLTS